MVCIRLLTAVERPVNLYHITMFLFVFVVSFVFMPWPLAVILPRGIAFMASLNHWKFITTSIYIYLRCPMKITFFYFWQLTSYFAHCTNRMSTFFPGNCQSLVSTDGNMFNYVIFLVLWCANTLYIIYLYTGQTLLMLMS